MFVLAVMAFAMSYCDPISESVYLSVCEQDNLKHYGQILMNDLGRRLQMPGQESTDLVKYAASSTRLWITGTLCLQIL